MLGYVGASRCGGFSSGIHPVSDISSILGNTIAVASWKAKQDSSATFTLPTYSDLWYVSCLPGVPSLALGRPRLYPRTRYRPKVGQQLGGAGRGSFYPVSLGTAGLYLYVCYKYPNSQLLSVSLNVKYYIRNSLETPLYSSI